MIRIANTPNFGIEKDEENLFVSAVDYTPSCETYEQLDKNGEVQGLVLYKQKVELSLKGEIPYQSTFSFGMGTTIALQNACPDTIWLGGEAPAGTTTVVSAAPYQASREGAQEVTVTATIYPFASVPE